MPVFAWGSFKIHRSVEDIETRRSDGARWPAIGLQNTSIRRGYWNLSFRFIESYAGYNLQNTSIRRGYWNSNFRFSGSGGQSAFKIHRSVEDIETICATRFFWFRRLQNTSIRRGYWNTAGCGWCETRHITFKIHRSVEDIETCHGLDQDRSSSTFKIHRSVEDIETRIIVVVSLLL